MSQTARRVDRRHAWRVLGCVAALALFACAVTFAVGRVEVSSSGPSHHATATHDATMPAFGRDHGLDAPGLHGLRLQPASRSRPSLFAVLAVGIVVAALARGALLIGGRRVARAFSLPGLRSGRGPPLARIA